MQDHNTYLKFSLNFKSSSHECAYSQIVIFPGSLKFYFSVYIYSPFTFHFRDLNDIFNTQNEFKH